MNVREQVDLDYAAAVIYSRGRWKILRQPPKRNDAPVATSLTP